MTWSRLKPMPTPRDAPQAVTAQGANGHQLLYVLGGRDRTQPRRDLSTVEAYDPDTDTWTTMAPMLLPLHAHVATRGPDGRIYVVGGTNKAVASTKAMQIYDPVTNIWTMGTPMPYGQECAAVTSTSGANGEILVLAGWDKHKRPLRRAVAYSPRTHTWHSLPSVPTAKAAAGAVTLEDADGSIHIYLLGGTGEGGSEKLHPQTSVETSVEEYSFRPESRSR